MELRKISDLFWRFSPNLFFLSIVLGVFTGLCYALLIPFVIYATSASMVTDTQLLVEHYNFFQSPTSEMAKIFLAACLTIIVIKSLSNMLSVYIAQKASVQHRIALYKRINTLSYANLEKIGQAKLINLLNLDIPALTAAASSLPTIWISLITIVGTLGYLVYLNTKIFIFVLVCLVIAVITYQLPILLAVKYFGRGREHYDRVQQGVTGLIYGAKELKLSQFKSKEYIDEELIAPEQATFKQNTIGQAIVTVTEAYGEIISFLVISVVIFHLPYIYHVTQLELFGIVMALLYLTGPVGMVLGAFNGMQHGKVALGKMTSFYDMMVEETVPFHEAGIPEWKHYRLDTIDYQYTDKPDKFALKNISLEFEKGQITFITGGNGSGKSTLSKLISLHYSPCAGNLYIGDTQLVEENTSAARELISVIYSDFFVFPKLYGDCESHHIHEYLKKLELDEKVKITDNRFDSVSLSDGQRKRLALLSLLLDDRPICLFDEWASDQDPRFKAIFYEEILPELKAREKVVIVISHDDRYFNCADQLVVMDQGSVREVIRR